MAGRFEVYQDSAGKYRWLLKAGDGEVVASGESVESRTAAVRGAEALRQLAPTAAPVAVGGGASTIEWPPAGSEQVSADDLVRDVLSEVSEETRSTFLHAVEASDSAAEGLDERLWGRAPTRRETRSAALVNLQRDFEARRRLSADSVSRAEAARLLSVSEQAVSALIKGGSLLTMKEGRELRIPAWQFSPDSPRGFLPGISTLAEAFPGGLTSLSEWVTRPNVELDGTTPAVALARGHVERVAEIARTSTAGAW